MIARVAAGVALACCSLLWLTAPAEAHPLGNFTVNHYDGLRLHPDRVEDLAVLDLAEIPTLQAGSVPVEQREAHAARSCAELAADLHASAGGRALRFTVLSSAFGYRPGSAGLPVSRLECRLSAPADLSRPSTLEFTDGHAADRIGWHEITAAGTGVHLTDSPVPAASVSQELRQYPNDLLSSPLDVRSARIEVRPGAGVSSAVAQRLPVAGPVARAVERVTQRFAEASATPHLTPAVGLLAVLLALLLGASHAALPGHGKTVIAAYLAGRAGSARDAVMVGATVTATHTAGVIALGLLLSAATALAGETLLAWLGVSSGLLIAAIGGALLRPHLRRLTHLTHRPAHDRVITLPETQVDVVARAAAVVDLNKAADGEGAVPGEVRGPAVAVEGRHVTSYPHDADDHHDHNAQHGHGHALPAEADHGHGHGHGHALPAEAQHGHGHGHGHALPAEPEHGHGHALLAEAEHGHGHGHSLAHAFGVGHGHGRPAPAPDGRIGRRGLVAMGVAGGMVPSPSALVVLLGAISLGRTLFGILLVFCYGLGMAATLTAVGLLLVRLRDRVDTDRFTRLSRYTPALTATLVLVVGLGLAARAAAPLV